MLIAPSPKNFRYLPGPVPIPAPDNSQTACDRRFRAGPLRGELASPRVSAGWGPGPSQHLRYPGHSTDYVSERKREADGQREHHGKFGQRGNGKACKYKG